MARLLSQLEWLEMIYSERMKFRVEIMPTNHDNMVCARFNHPLGTVVKFLPSELLPGCLDQACLEMQRYAR